MPLKREPSCGESGVSYLMQGSFGPRESAHQLDNTGQHVAIVMVTTVRIIATAQIDPWYSSDGANMNPSLMHGSLGPRRSAPQTA